jgi:hypothetical protein
MTNRYDGGSAVRSGYYLDPARWHIEPVAHDGERLPDGRSKWVRIPTAAALALVPVLGAAFVVFLPFVGVALTLRALASPVMSYFRTSATEIAATVSPGWQPGEAHFTGKRPESARVEEKGPVSARDERLDALAREIESRRLQLRS